MKFTLSMSLLGLAVLVCGSPAMAQDASAPWVQAIESPQYFAVSVEQIDRSVAWYRSVLGLRQVDDTTAENGSWRIVNLVGDNLFVELIRDDRDQAVERARGFAKVGFHVPEVEDVADRVAAATGDRPRVLSFEPHGIRLLQLRDPDGNIVQLSSPLEPITSDRETAVRAAVAEFGQAFKQADVAALESLLTADYVHVNGGSGSVLSRGAWLSWIATRRSELESGALVIRDYDVEDVTVSVRGDNAFVTGVVRSRGSRNGEAFSSNVRFTNVWVSQGGAWRRASFHDSRLPE